MESASRNSNLREEPIGALAKRLSEQAATLVRQELALAQVELKEKGKHAGIGGGLFGAAGLVALFGLGTLVAAIVLLVATALEPWLAALIVAVGLFVVAGALGLAGKGQVEQATPPVPEQAQRSVKADVQEIKGRAKASG